MSQIIAIPVEQYAIYTLRWAAEEWLREHPDDSNAPAVVVALIATNYVVNPKADAE